MNRAAQAGHTEPSEGWTERQRQVLDLIVKGKSNGEIAEVLGVSLDGVKWHMREILSKLGVESRVEAAEYWRRRNGLPSRFSRTFRALAGLITGKAGLAAIAGVVCVVTAGLAIVLLRSSDTADSPTAPTESPTVQTSPSATGTISPGATPNPNAIEVNGRSIPLRQSFLTPREDRPRNLALVVTHGCWSCDQPDSTIERIWWDEDGNQSTDVLFDAKDRGGSYLTSIASGTDGSHMVVGLCIRAYCGPLGEYQDAARVQLWESSDYGSSWKVIGELDGQAFPLGFTQDGLIISRFLRAGTGFDHDLLNWNTGEHLVWPDWDSGSRPNPLVVETGVFWIYPGGKVLDGDFKPFGPELPSNLVNLFPGRVAGSFIWSHGSEIEAPSGLLLSQWDEGGKVVDALLLPTHTFWRPSRVAGTLLIVGSMAVADVGQLPVLVNPGTGEVTRIFGPFEALAKANDRNVVLAAQVGPFARVKAPGDCLNLRDSPGSGDILTCVGDGVLLTVLGADNVSALPVVFGPYTGWVSFDFVEFPATAR